VKSIHRALVAIGLLLTSLSSLSCGLVDLLAPTPTPTNTPTPIPTATSTPSSTPTATATLTPTPIQARFNHPPAYLETVFSDAGWIWRDTSNTRTGTRRHDSKTLIFLSHSIYQIAIGGIWDIDSGDKEFVDGLFPIALQDFVAFATSVDIIQFKDVNANNEPGSYTTIIDGFEVELSIEDNPTNNTRTLIILVSEYR